MDEDCDDSVDEEPVDGDLRYPDEDGDGFGDEVLGDPFCATPVGRVAEGGDCNDQDAAIHPEATEVCNEGIDDDCDGAIDDDDDSLDRDTRSLYFEDADSDGFGNPRRTTEACAAPEGYVSDDTDCDDTLSDVNPGAEEVCDDGLDNDCDSAALGCGLSGELTSADETFTGDAVLALDVAGLLLANGGAAAIHRDGAVEDILRNYSAGDLTDGHHCGIADGVMWTGDASVNLGATECAVGDFDGDGESEAAGAKALETDVYSADVTSLEGRIAGGGRVRSADVNVDGVADLLAWTPTGVGIWTGPITSDQSLDDTLVTVVGSLDDFAILDFTADGHPDLVVGAPEAADGSNEGAGVAWVFFGPVHSEYTSAGATATIYGAAGDGVGSSLCSGDVDGDGDEDLWIGGSLIHYLHAGPSSGTTDPANAEAWATTTGGCGAADLDEDGKSETAVTSGGEIWLLNGRGL